GVITKAVWPLAWPGIYIVEDIAKTSSIYILSFTQKPGAAAFLFTKTSSPISAIGYSADSDKIIMGTYSEDTYLLWAC
uniref:Uncharacterized protein n=1 Tax=Amphimedon queenslandica TaxID=400682 RepID=A0A1X7SY10_AMPQE